MDSPTSNTILKACRLGEIAALDTALTKCPELLNQADSNLGWTPLYRTVICGHEEATNWLLSRGANPNVCTKMGETPLHQAADNGKVSLVRSLLEHHANPDTKQNDGDTALHFAATKGSLETTLLLLEYGASPNISNTVLGRTPLHNAAQYSHYAVAQALLQAGASPSARDKAGLRPVDFCSDAALQALLASDSSSETVASSSPSSCEDSKESEQQLRASLKAAFQLNIEAVCNPGQPTPRARLVKAQSSLYHWLVSYQLEEYLNVLADNGYDDVEQIKTLHTLSPLTEDMLTQMGMQKSGHRRRLLAALEAEVRPAPAVQPARRKPRLSVFRCCSSSAATHSEVHSVPSLYQWLASLNLEQHYKDFVNNGYEEVEYLLGLMHTPWAIDEPALMNIGIVKPGYRHRILAKLGEDCEHVHSLRRADCGGVTGRRLEEIKREAPEATCKLM